MGCLTIKADRCAIHVTTCRADVEQRVTHVNLNVDRGLRVLVEGRAARISVRNGTAPAAVDGHPIVFTDDAGDPPSIPNQPFARFLVIQELPANQLKLWYGSNP